MTSYNFWIQQAKRFDNCVDYGSPVTAWNNDMFRILKECSNDILLASKKYMELKSSKVSQ